MFADLLLQRVDTCMTAGLYAAAWSQHVWSMTSTISNSLSRTFGKLGHTCAKLKWLPVLSKPDVDSDKDPSDVKPACRDNSCTAAL